MDYTNLKHEARARMAAAGNGIYFMAIPYLLVTGCIGYITGNGGFRGLIISLLVLYVLSLLEYGFVRYCIGIARGYTPSINDFFAAFSPATNILIAVAAVAALVYVGFIFLFIPGIYIALQYSLVNYILEDNPGMDAFAAMQYSKELMQGRKIKLFTLRLSFLGWYFAAIFTFGILAPFTFVYMGTTNALFYEECVALSGGQETTKTVVIETYESGAEPTENTTNGQENGEIY